MLLQELIDEELIIMDLKPENKSEAIKEMVELFVKKGVVKDRKEFTSAINKREEIESTGIGYGIAIPHAKSNSVKELKVAFGRIKQGVNFKALDELLVYFVFMVAAPQEATSEYLQAIAKVLRFLRSRTRRNALLEMESAEKVMELIRDFESMGPQTLRVKTKEGRVIYKRRVRDFED